MIRGNNAADKAQTAAKCQVGILAPMVTLEPLATPGDIILIQKEVNKDEQDIWRR